MEENHFVYEDKKLSVTISIGVADYRQGVQRGVDLFKRADSAVYKSKKKWKKSSKFLQRITAMLSETNPRPPIALLPNHLIDQIKAGEVVQGPSAVLKELLENSLDAKAKAIRVEIANNGLDLIHIEDDGHGMFQEDLPNAFSSAYHF